MRKVLFALMIVLFLLIGFPLFIEEFLSPAGKEAWYFAAFLLVYPVFIGALGIFSGSDIKKLWFLPIVVSVLIVPAIWLIKRNVDSSLLIYTAIYFVIGLVTMGISEILFDRAKNSK